MSVRSMKVTYLDARGKEHNRTPRNTDSEQHRLMHAPTI